MARFFFCAGMTRSSAHRARLHSAIGRWFAPPKELFLAMRRAYLPLMFGYFAHSLSGMFGMGSGITTVPVSFWIQENLLIPPAYLAFMSFTIALPWISKILFGQLVDSWTVRIRKRVLFFSGSAMMGGFLVLAALAGEYWWLTALRGYFGFDATVGIGDSLPEALRSAQQSALISYQFFFLALGYFLVSATMCLQDVILDPLGRHIVSKKDDAGRPLSEEAYRRRVGVVQVWCRISFNAASIIGLVVGGLLMAYGVPMDRIFLATLVVPVMSVVFIQFISLPHEVAVGGVSVRIILSALGLILIAVITQLFNLPLSREISFVATLGVVIYLMRILARKRRVAPDVQRGLIFTAVTLALVMMIPGLGEGASWWFRDELGYTRQFETNLGIFGGVISLMLLIFTYRSILRGHLGTVLVVFNVVLSILSSAGLFFWHGGHVWLGGVLGVEPLQVVRYIAWINTAAMSPFQLLYGMIMFIFLAQYADDEGTATWFTVFAVFFNLSMTGGSLMTGYLNQLFVVERGVYGELGKLMWTSWTVGLVFPVAVVLLLLTPWRKNSDPLAYEWWRKLVR